MGLCSLVLLLAAGPNLSQARCAQAIAGGSDEQRHSRESEDKEAVHSQVCSSDCAPQAREAYGARAWELLCAGPGAVTDPLGGIWGLAAPKTHATSELGIARVGNSSVGLFGGISFIGLTVATVEVYDDDDNSWRAVADLPLPTNHPMPATSGGRAFLAGGGLFPLGNPDRDTLFEYDAEGDTWLERQPMPTSRSAGAAAELDGRLYFVGGWEPRGHDVASYDPNTDRWEILATLAHQRNHLVVASTDDGKLIAAGGRTSTGLTGTRVVEVYDVATNEWTERTSMPPSEHSVDGAYSGHNGIVVQGCLHTFGGEHSSGVFPEHLVYDPYTGESTRSIPSQQSASQ